jgi:GTP cyclohydrolase III
MLPVRVSVAVGHQTVPLERVTDARISSALRSAAQDVGRKLSAIRCPVHQKTAVNVRMHFDQRGTADLQYDSCCEKLGQRIGEALGA